jgi:gliding motility-associated-like protein
MSINFASTGASGIPFIDNGGEIPVFTIEGITPEGISINPSTGNIAFANSVQVGVYPLIITATNSKGSINAPFELTVVGLKPSNLAYTPNVIVTDFRTEVASVIPTVNMGGLPVTFSLLGTVPTGISIHPQTGVITSSSKTVEGIYNLIVKASNEVGSETTSFIITVVGPAIIPQGFSPNGDGENDVFQLVGLENGPYKLSIFNRWGNIVFEKENYQNDWGGETNKSYALIEADGLLADATYYYIIESANDKTKVGYVYINRSNQNK